MSKRKLFHQGASYSAIRHFRTMTPNAFRMMEPDRFKFKIKIKDPDENQLVTPIDYDKTPLPMDGSSALATQRPRSSLGRMMIDPKTAAKTRLSWPLMKKEMTGLAVADWDLPLGIKFNVAYHDTHAYEHHDGPIAFFLHGLKPPEMFRAFVEPLLRSGFRIIAPIMPLTGHTSSILKPPPNTVTTSTEMNLFSHSTIERTMFIQEFLKAILPAKKVDVLITSDVGAYPACCLCNTNNHFNSLLMLDPFPPKTIPYSEPAWLFKLMSKNIELPFFPLKTTALPFILLAMRRFGSRSIKEASAHIRHFGFADLPSVDGSLTSMEMREFPAVVWASQGAKFVSRVDSEEVMFRLGIESKNVTVIETSEISETSETLRDNQPPLPLASSSNVGRFYPAPPEDTFGEYHHRFAKPDYWQYMYAICSDIVGLASRSKSKGIKEMKSI